MSIHRARRPLTARRHNAVARLEALEPRLVLSWGSTPPATIAVPSTAAAVTLNSQGDAAGTAAITASEVDFYTFVAPTSGSYRFAATTPSSSLDTVLGVYSASGARVAYNDDISSFNTDSQATATLSAGSRYYLGITNYSGTRGGSYNWLVDGPAVATTVDDSFEDNDTRATASNLGTLTAQRTVSNLALADSADWFAFATTSAGASGNAVSISFQASQGDLGLELVNSAGQVVGSSNTANGVETVSLAGLGAGTYYARVFGTNGATNPSYTLTVAPPTGGGGAVPGGFDIVVRASGLTATQQAAFDTAAARWEQVIVGDLPDATYGGVAVDDLLIDAQSVAIDGAGGVLGSAGPDTLRSGSRLPIHGTMRFDTADLDSMERSGTLTEVILHEMGHVLGFGTIWQTLGLLSGAGTANPQFLGTRATAEYNAIFGTSASGVPVEGTPAPQGTRDGHWRESLFGNELMSGYIGAAGNPISRITVASLADIGYTVNLAAADAYTPPSAARSFGTPTGGSTAGPALVADEPDGSPTVSIPTARRSPAARSSFARPRGPRAAIAWA